MTSDICGLAKDFRGSSEKEVVSCLSFSKAANFQSNLDGRFLISLGTYETLLDCPVAYGLFGDNPHIILPLDYTLCQEVLKTLDY